MKKTLSAAMILLSVVVLAATRADAQLPELPEGIASVRSFTMEQLSRDHLRLSGGVHVQLDAWNVHADRIDVFAAESRLTASGNVVVDLNLEPFRGSGQTITTLDDSARIRLSGSVFVSSGRVQMTAAQLEIDEATGLAYAAAVEIVVTGDSQPY